MGDINHANKEGDTALLTTTGRGYTDSMLALIIAKADIDHVNDKGNTALIVACRSGPSYGKAAETLINARAELNYANKENYTALFWAAIHDIADIVKNLITAAVVL